MTSNADNVDVISISKNTGVQHSKLTRIPNSPRALMHIATYQSAYGDEDFYALVSLPNQFIAKPNEIDTEYLIRGRYDLISNSGGLHIYRTYVSIGD